MLKSITLTGFKSFAKKGELTFQHPITAIVGPNGSGKSNTAEAFRFVLGEQGSRVMRVKRSTDLIWAGSHTLPGASRAGVRMVLDNSRGQLQIDFDEVVVERTVLKDGAHEYFVNGSRVRLRDVQELLAGANVGASGHHIISQGEADRILGASSKERREMLEDALGLKSYILKQQEASRKLEQTRDNIREAELARRELTPQLKFLERQVAQARERETLKAQLRDVASTYLASEHEALSREREMVTGALPSAQAHLARLDAALAALRAQLEVAQVHEEEGGDTDLVQRIRRAQHTLGELQQAQSACEGQLALLTALRTETKQAPHIPRTEVEGMLERIEHTLTSQGDDALTRVRAVVAELLTYVRGSDVIQQEHDNHAAREAELTTQLRNLTQQAEQQRARLTELQDEQAAHEASKHDTTALERDMFKLTAERNEQAAEVRELEHRESALKRREVLLKENRTEVQILLAEELTLEHQEGRVLDEADMEEHRRLLERLKVQLEGYTAAPAEVFAEYESVRDRHEYLAGQVTDLTDAERKLSALITELDASMHAHFAEGLAKINATFAEFFGTLFGGGTASLSLTDDGVEIQAQLPRKKIASLDTLSGGERALASIALIFAMSQVNPPPFIILDETDAALDEANSRRYAEMVRKLSERSQLILITHNRATMAAADKLYGVTMGNDGVSQLLSVTLTDAAQYAK